MHEMEKNSKSPYCWSTRSGERGESEMTEVSQLSNLEKQCVPLVENKDRR